MESQKPWLAEFIKSSLDAWFRELEGCRSADYQFQKIDDSLKASYKAPCQQTVYLLKLPKLGTTEPRGEISDGIHKIESIFTKGTASEIIDSGAQHGTPLQLVDPVLRVTPHVNPPKPLLEITTCKIVDEADRIERNLSSGCAVTEDQDVRKRMSKYWAKKRHNRAPSTPASRGSPASIKSQVAFSPPISHRATNPDGDVEKNDEEDLSQQPFCTQVPNGLSGWNLTTPTEPTPLEIKRADTSEQEEHFLPSAQDIQGGNGVPDCIPSNQTQQPAPKLLTTAEIITPSNESVLPPSTTTGQGRGLAPRRLSHSANPTLPRLQVTPTLTADNEKSSPVEISELGGNVPESPGHSADHAYKEPCNLATKWSPPKRIIVTRSDQERPSRFQRWRDEAQAGRYIPRHIQKIPKKQAKLLASLLESGDSWQPPLVGRTQRPGEVPLELLVELSDAADERASGPASSSTDVEPEASGQDPRPTEHGQGQDLKPANPSEGNASDSEEFADWSQSPPTQQRRATKLPPNSPLPDLTRQKRLSYHADSREKESAMLSGQEPSSGSATSQARGSKVQSSTHDHGPLPLGSGSHQSASSAEDTPLSAQLQHADVNDKSSSQEDNASMVAGVSDGSSSKKIQVTRTPYGGKGSSFPRLIASRMTSTMAKNGLDDGNPTSTFVPGTYNEPSSGVLAAVAMKARSSAPLPVDGSSNPTPDSDPNSHTVAHFEPQVSEATRFEDANPDKTSSPICGASLDNTLSASADSQEKVQPGPDQRHLPFCGNSDDLGSRLQQSELAGARVVDAGGGAGRRNRAIGAENSPGSSKEAGPRADENALVQSVSQTHELISVLAKRKRTNSGISDVPIKRQRQEQEGATDHENGKEPEHREQRPPEPDMLYDVIRCVMSTPQITTGRNGESLLCEERTQYRQETSRMMGNPQASTRDSLLSSREDDDGRSGPMGSSPKQGRRHQQLDSANNTPRRSSTPITRQSAYGGVSNGEVKAIPAEPGVGNDLFTRYQAAYPDYKGNAEDFFTSYCFIKEIWTREPGPKLIHQCHLDDAVFHHFHSYRPYAGTAGTAAVGFFEFFHDFIEDPSHHQRIIRPSAFENQGGTPRRTSVGDVSLHQEGQSFATAPVSSTKTGKPLTVKETIAVQQQRFKQLVQTGEAIEDRIDSNDSIERWREDAARAPSPELGTPDVDRSLSTRTTPRKGSPGPAIKTSMPPTPNPPEPLEPSPGLFVKPQNRATESRPRQVTAKTANTTKSSSVRPKKRASRGSWRGTSTAFTKFEQEVAKLAAQERRASSETWVPSRRG
ncbi:uncharacterized protein Z520_08228 [Fonsecaea multimorphosa CBS 102226]|uniref:Telomere replication protein EST3 n=1 Tax=Fonsecaea multimorphosa CBS 102226 TaxID=1442371 RepID=A0A0D2KH55_9EURO|nr:uncharacterized protein Z520_08228 [Fonsecaea multimorphosa CBS 102226]KIX95973.1 hypothetical protein Z520_08228 [Fonsecaea multimorphosa CBS 102226]OAL21743.1 hypothetical protein AYO22_07685 [Fonsecaea multimorphosa]